MEQFQLRNLPPYGKLFVALFTALMLLVCLWAVSILYVDKGMVEEGSRPDYYDSWRGDVGGAESGEKQIIEEEVGAITADKEAVLAPIWDSTLAGEEVEVDSETMVEGFADREKQLERESRESVDNNRPENYDQLRRNVGLAHTHINGQTLLFFAMGLVFLFSSVPPKRKMIVFWVFAVAVVLHATGLSGETFHWFYDDILAISGVTLLIVMSYMALSIFADLAKKKQG